MNIKLEFPVETLNTLLQGLAELPFKASSPIIQYIQLEAQNQIKPPGPTDLPTKKPKKR